MQTKLSVRRELGKEFSEREARLYVAERGKNTRFYFNCYGWDTYYTLKPTFATPSGNLRGFPRCVTFKVNI
jgi:hypothetical protein